MLSTEFGGAGGDWIIWKEGDGSRFAAVKVGREERGFGSEVKTSPVGSITDMWLFPNVWLSFSSRDDKSPLLVLAMASPITAISRFSRTRWCWWVHRSIKSGVSSNFLLSSGQLGIWWKIFRARAYSEIARLPTNKSVNLSWSLRNDMTHQIAGRYFYHVCTSATYGSHTQSLRLRYSRMWN